MLIAHSQIQPSQCQCVVINAMPRSIAQRTVNPVPIIMLLRNNIASGQSFNSMGAGASNQMLICMKPGGLANIFNNVGGGKFPNLFGGTMGGPLGGILNGIGGGSDQTLGGGGLSSLLKLWLMQSLFNKKEDSSLSSILKNSQPGKAIERKMHGTEGEEGKNDILKILITLMMLNNGMSSFNGGSSLLLPLLLNSSSMSKRHVIQEVNIHHNKSSAFVTFIYPIKILDSYFCL